MHNLISDNHDLNIEEREVLNKVCIEIKFFSRLSENRNSIAINSTQDYENAIQEVNDAELSVF